MYPGKYARLLKSRYFAGIRFPLMPLTVKKIVGKIHLWLGLAAGLVVLVSLTAASVFVWEEELTDWYHHDKVFVKEVKAQRLPFDSLLKQAKTVSKNHNVTYISVYPGASRAFVFMNFKPAKKKGWTYASTVEDYSRIYVDPYTGKVLGVIDMPYDWIFCLRMLHQSLLLNYDLGHFIVGYATLIILIMVITGIVLWWPRNKAALKQRLWFRWKPTTRWKRKNYDVHNIGGMYSFLFILLFAMTGLVWTFDWWTDTIYRVLGNDPAKVFSKPKAPVLSANSSSVQVYDKVLADVNRRVPGWTEIGFGLQADTVTKKAAITTFVHYASGHSGWDESDYYSYHPQTGEMYFSNTQDQKTLGARWRNSNYAIHVGSIYGLPTKILAFFIALFCASLPVTGFLVWWGRKKKKILLK
jgi:uncharacterized iron-regulated membrane protein